MNLTTITSRITGLHSGGQRPARLFALASAMLLTMVRSEATHAALIFQSPESSVRFFYTPDVAGFFPTSTQTINPVPEISSIGIGDPYQFTELGLFPGTTGEFIIEASAGQATGLWGGGVALFNGSHLDLRSPENQSPDSQFRVEYDMQWEVAYGPLDPVISFYQLAGVIAVFVRTNPGSTYSEESFAQAFVDSGSGFQSVAVLTANRNFTANVSETRQLRTYSQSAELIGPLAEGARLRLVGEAVFTITNDEGPTSVIFQDFTVGFLAIPEPATAGLLGIGVAALLRRRRMA